MNETEKRAVLHSSPRRQAIVGLAMAFTGLIASSRALGISEQQSMKEIPSSSANRERTALHQEIEFKADPWRIYKALLDSKEFAAFTGAPATIDSTPGGSFTLFGGLIVGRNIETVPSQRVVQAWRPTHWEPGVYSIVKFDLRPNAAFTVVVLDHTGFPEGDFDHLEFGWHNHYWEPLKKYLG